MQEDENDGRRTNKKRHRRRQKRRKPTKLAYFLLLLLVALCAAAVCMAVFFKVDTISVSGKSSYSAAQVISASGITNGTSLFHINKVAAVKKICSSLPFVADAKIAVCPPSTVKVEITADSPKYAIKSSKQYAYLDNGLKALEKIADAKKYTGIIAISGAEITKFDAGHVITLKDKTQVATIDTLTAAIKEAGISKITSMDVTDSNQLTVVYDSRITIIIGTPLGADKKLEDAAAIIKSKIQLSDKGSLDVSAQNKRYTFSPS